MPTATTAAEAAARSRLITVESYAVFLDLTDGDSTAHARTEVVFRCHHLGASTFADLDPVRMHAATLDGDPLGAAALSDGRLRLDHLAARNILTVAATVAITTSGQGLTRYTDPADEQQYVLANCYPTAAPRIFCCFDQPDLRAALSLIVALPAGWVCVSNGELLHRPDEGAAGVWRFATVPALTPFDFTLAAGPYVTADTRRVRRSAAGTSDQPGAADAAATAAEDAAATAVENDAAAAAESDAGAEIVLAIHCRRALVRSAGLTRLADIVAAALAYYEQLLAVPCPGRKVDIALVPELVATAMQMPGVMYVSEALLQRAADPGDDFVPVVVAHEVAHLWFGCLVQIRWWDDLWLAEAMASYLSYLAASAVLGQPHAWAGFGMTGQAGAYQADGLPSTQPVSSPVATAADALTRPTAITYSKGTSVVCQLSAFVGADSVHAGLHDYLTQYAWTSATLGDLTDCWSASSERDLEPWAAQWLKQPGLTMLQPEIIADPDGTITSLAIVQRPAAGGRGAPRTHRLTIGCYELAEDGLTRRQHVTVTVRGAWTHVPELTGMRRPAAIILNDADLTYATTRFDPVSWHALVATGMDVSDPLAESVCWTTACDMVQHAELDATELVALVSRRITSGGPVVGLDALLDRAATIADFFTTGTSREGARRQLAAAALAAAERATPDSRRQRILARGFAAAADSPAQLDLLRLWLGGRSLPEGLALDLELRASTLATLAARDLLGDDDLVAYAAADPVSCDTVVAGCCARRPALAAKETAWAAALAAGQPVRLARAYAEGFWVPGQEELTAAFRARYFTEALPALRRRHDARAAQRLARALYPATLADEVTLAATNDALASTASSDPIRAILLEQQEMARRVRAARRMDASLLLLDGLFQNRGGWLGAGWGCARKCAAAGRCGVCDGGGWASWTGL